MNSLYNRYVPQSDGSFQRNRINDQQNQNRQQKEEKQQPVKPCPPPTAGSPSNVPQTSRETGAIGFLRQLLPKDFDTGDLLIVLLLLLMAGDCEEEKSNALLTLALYFFM